MTVVLDGFAFTLYVADPQDAIEYTATHHGAEFLAAATRHGHVEVFVSSGVDPRRSTPADLDASATAGSMVGARVGAFAVQTLGT